MTLELETPSPVRASEEAADDFARGVASSRPWRLSDVYWESLAPRGTYARMWRAPFLYLVSLVLFPAAVLVALPIACINRREHGGWRRVLFVQRRVGRRGRIFRLLKFRTMADVPGEDHARVTPFGRFLRNTHLDELPQLLNVLRGEMCLIGPRPEMLSTERWAASHCPEFKERLVMAPGLTGYAQITQGYTQGGDLEGYRRKLELNRVYLGRISFGADCAILVRTALWMLRGRGWLPAPQAAGEAQRPSARS